MSHRILIAEDHALIRHGLRAVLAGDSRYQVADEAVDGREVVTKAARLLPDLIIMDMSLPGTSSIDATAQIRRRVPQQKVLALSDEGSELLVGEALRAGCCGFILKQSSPTEILAAIQASLAGKRYISASLADMLLDGILPGGSPRRRDPWESLTHRERSVFKLLAEGGTNKTVGQHLNLSAKTIEKHRANLMRKLQARSAVELMLIAVELGLVTRPQIHFQPVGAMALDATSLA